MQKEMIEFTKKYNLSPFNSSRTEIKNDEESIFKTRDAKAIHNKVLSKIASNFYFADTSSLFKCFPLTSNLEEIKSRQEFIKTIQNTKKSEFLKNLARPKPAWRPKYNSIVVTEDEKTFTNLQKLGCPTKFIISQYDLDSLDNYDIVQVIDCDQYSQLLESLPQVVFLDHIEQAYLERYVELLSGWKNNLEILKNNDSNAIISELVSELYPLLELTNNFSEEKLSPELIEIKLEEINKEISSEIKKLTVSGDALFSMLSGSTLPPELSTIIKNAVNKSGMPSHIFNLKVPVSIDNQELDRVLKEQNAKEHTGIAEKVKKKSNQLVKIPKILEELSNQILIFDFISGLSNFIQEFSTFPTHSSSIQIFGSKNVFLENAQAINFSLSEEERCSILTGANSGGKTTLLEHVLQLISLYQLGLPVSGKITLPLFSEVYYFAKNKGSANKGAFETLLTQMSKIKPGKQTLILADEIESVTEPGVAGIIVAASAEYFIKKGCFLIIATHLGKEIQRILPKFARIDGIEAKGLNENFELIVDHNPVLGRLANSTPELIVERMANSQKTEYFTHLNDFLKNVEK